MAVTDLTPAMPGMGTQGAPGPQGPGAVGTPSAAPMGAGGAPGGSDATAWLQYLASMFGISPAQAAQLSQNGLPPGAVSALNQGGSPVPSALNGGGPPVTAAMTPPPPAPQGAQQGPPGYLGSQSATPPGSPGAPQSPSWFPGGNTPMPWRGPGAAPAPAAAAPAAGAATPVPGPLATGGASGSAATSNPRFVGVSAPNASPQNSMRGGPQMTALNLAGLFGGQGAANPNVPAANAQPVSAQRPVPGPLANAPMPPVMPDDIRRQRAMQLAAASLKQRYG